MNPATKKPKQKEKKISVSQMMVFIVVFRFNVWENGGRVLTDAPSLCLINLLTTYGNNKVSKFVV